MTLIVHISQHVQLMVKHTSLLLGTRHIIKCKLYLIVIDCQSSVFRYDPEALLTHA